MKTITIISHFTREEVLSALRAQHPWLPENVQLNVAGTLLHRVEIEYTKQSDLVVSREE